MLPSAGGLPWTTRPLDSVENSQIGSTPSTGTYRSYSIQVSELMAEAFKMATWQLEDFVKRDAGIAMACFVKELLEEWQWIRSWCFLSG